MILFFIYQELWMRDLLYNKKRGGIHAKKGSFQIKTMDTFKFISLWYFWAALHNIHLSTPINDDKRDTSHPILQTRDGPYRVQTVVLCGCHLSFLNPTTRPEGPNILVAPPPLSGDARKVFTLVSYGFHSLPRVKNNEFHFLHRVRVRFPQVHSRQTALSLNKLFKTADHCV